MERWRLQAAVSWLIKSAAVVLACLGQWAAAQTAFSLRYSNTATTGDIVLIGNVNYYCTTDRTYATRAEANNCVDAMADGNVTNNDVTMRRIDTDNDPNTNNSSSATLNLPTGSTVLFAGLYWSGVSTSANNRANVSFSPPGGTGSSLTASNVYTYSTSAYQSFADVTATVKAAGSGVYTVGNIASTQTSGAWGGWTLVVAFKNSSLPTRNLAVFDGFQYAGSASQPVDIAVSGFLTPSLGTVNSTIGVVAYDGDRGANEGASATPPGSLKFGPSTSQLSPVYNAVNPINDVFNSTISALGSNVTAGRDPMYTNTLGLDIDTFTPNTPLPNGSTSAVVRVIGTSGDVIYPGVITLATDIFIPNIKDSLTKTVTDVNGGAVLPGDVLEYELYLKNEGNDGALGLVLSDVLPANTTFVPGSITVVSGANTGSKTDAAADDQAEYTASTRTVTVRLGTGANASTGGQLLPGQEARVRFRVTVNSGTPGGTVINNSGQVTYKQQTIGAVVTDISDSDPNTPGDQPASITVSGPDLQVSKTHVGNFTKGQEGTFTLTVTNAGASATTGSVTLSDTLPAGLSAVSIGGSGWTCVLASLSCTRNDPLAVGASYPVVTLTVTATQTGALVNQASVSGGGEAASLTGNNSASDSVTVVAPNPPAVTLTKTVRNVTRNGAETTANTALPGDTLEYCITFSNSGGEAWNFRILDSVPSNAALLSNAYGPGLGLILTTAGGTNTLTSAADTDIGTLTGQDVLLNYGTLGAGATGKVCFQAQLH